ncbi:MAG: ABC transporter permease [Acidobacteria bacterium]|nr:ABC transporter permease [Acidobacteriota bacterium]
MWKATIRGLLAHKLRLALTALAVVLGVGFVTGTYVLTDTMNRAFTDLFRDAVAGVDVYVRSHAAFAGPSAETERRPIPERLLETVRGVEGVRVAEGSVAGYAQLVDRRGKAVAPMGPPTLGVSWTTDRTLASLTIRAGRAPERPGEAVLDAVSARAHGFGVGDSVTVLFQGPTERFRVVGIAGFGEADNMGGATLVAFDLRTAQRVLGRPGALDTIEVAADPGVPAATLRDRIAAVLPPGVEAVTGRAVGSEEAKSLQEALSFFRTALLVFAGVALFVGAFIIFNTFGILVTQRARELALLRALGASRSQVTRSVVAESAIVGAVASGAGIGAGVLMALALRGLLAAFGIDLPSVGLQILPRTIVISLVVGIAVTLAASVLPARRAGRVSPIEALRDAEADRPTSLRTRSFVGGIGTVGGAAALGAGLFAGAGIGVVGAGVAAVFLGVAILAPLVARPLARVIGAPFARLRGLTGRLGRENAMRNPRRTAATSSALMVGLALVGTFLILGASLKVSLGKAIERSLRADYVLTAGSHFTGFSPALAERLRGRPEIAAVSEIRIGFWRKPGSTSLRMVTAVDPATVERVLALGVRPGNVAGLRPDEVLVSRRAAERGRIRVGDRLDMEFPASGTAPLTVAGLFDEGGLVGDYAVSLAAYGRLFTSRLDSMVLVRAAPGRAPGEVRGVLAREIGAFPSVRLEDQAGMRRQQEGMIDQLLGLVTALLGLAVVIALLGIVNTLALAVFERRREFGLLRAVGMSRRQVRAMVRHESVIIALIGGVLGLGIGLFFGWALVAALGDAGVTELALPTAQLAVFLALAGLAGVLAAVLPARRAARVDILRAVTVD